MQAFLEYVLKELVDFPEDVKVSSVPSDKGRVFELRLRNSDVGKVVGKQGQTIAAIRSIVNSVAAQKNERIEIEIIEE